MAGFENPIVAAGNLRFLRGCFLFSREERNIKSGMKAKIKKIWNWVNGVLIGLVVLLAIALAGVRLVGWDIYVVLSGSMEPEYRTGSVIYVKEADPEDLGVQDVITFRLDEDTIATHRIIEITEIDGQAAFRTKGDANEREDAAAVPVSQVVGTPVFTIPYLGYLVEYIHSTSGRYATIAMGATLLFLVFLPDILFGEDEKKKEKAE